MLHPLSFHTSFFYRHTQYFTSSFAAGRSNFSVGFLSSLRNACRGHPVGCYLIGADWTRGLLASLFPIDPNCFSLTIYEKDRRHPSPRVDPTAVAEAAPPAKCPDLFQKRRFAFPLSFPLPFSGVSDDCFTNDSFSTIGIFVPSALMSHHNNAVPPSRPAGRRVSLFSWRLKFYPSPSLRSVPPLFDFSALRHTFSCDPSTRSPLRRSVRNFFAERPFERDGQRDSWHRRSEYNDETLSWNLL